MLLLAVTFMAMGGCNGTPPPPPTTGPTNAGVKPASTPSQQKPVPPQNLPQKTFTKGWIVVEVNLPANLSKDVTLEVKGFVGPLAKLSKPFAFTKGTKDFFVVALGSNELQGLTAFTIEETSENFGRYVVNQPTVVPTKWAREIILTNDLTVEEMMSKSDDRGIFTTPIGVRIYLQE
jgi:hypothetical protein